MDRYRIGAGGNWNDTTYWSDSENGSGGFSVPTSADNVFFTQYTLTGTITVNVAANMLDFDVTGLTANVTLSNAVYNFSVYGNLKLSNFLITSFTSTGYLYLRATTSVGIWANGTTKSWNIIYFDGIGGTWTNQDDWNAGSSGIYLVNGTWNQSIYNVSTKSFEYGVGTATLTMVSGTFSTYEGCYFHINSGNKTFNCGTGKIKNTSQFSGGILYSTSITYYNIETRNVSLQANLNCHDLTIETVSSGLNQFVLAYNANISGALKIDGYNDTNIRLLVASNTIGTPRTITAANVIASNVDFRDINFTNPIDLSAITGGSGDAGGNSNITFTPAQPQYYKHTGGGTTLWSDATKWFSDSNLTVAGRVPLPQDDANFLAGSFSQACTLSVNVPRIGRSLDMELVNQTVTFSLANSVECYGSFVLGNNITPSGNVRIDLMGRGGFILNTFEKTLSLMWINAKDGYYTVMSNLSFTSWISARRGTLDFNGYNCTGARPFDLDDASPSVYLRGGTFIGTAAPSGYAFYGGNGTLYAGTSTIIIQASGASDIEFRGGGKSFNKVYFTGSYTGNINITYSSNYNEIIIDAGRKVRITNGTTQTINRLRVLGKPSNLSTLASTTAGSRATITMSSNDYLIDYTNIKDINFTNATKVGQNSVDLGNNVNADFLSTVMRYWVGNSGNWNDTTHWSLQSNGASGAVVPTATENAIFDLNSFSLASQTITVNAAANMLALWTEGVSQSFTLSNAVYNLSVYGSLYISSNLNTNFTSTGYLYFRATDSRSIYANGTTKFWNRIYMDGVGGTWTNQDNWNAGSSGIYLTNGTWNTNDKTITITSIELGIGTKTLNFGSSNVFCNSIIDFNVNNANFTLNAGTSIISIFGGGGAGLYPNGKTFYNVITNNISASGNPIFNNLTYPNISGTKGGFRIGEYGGTSITVNDTLNVSGSNSSTGRSLIQSNTLGTPRTITVNGSIVASNVDFRDIVGAGTTNWDLSNIVGGSGDCGGNSNITFTPAQPQYYKHTGGGTTLWSDATKWFSDSNLTVAGRVPLPQDDANFLAGSFTQACTLSVNVPRIGRSLNMELVNQAVTMSLANVIECYGSFVLGNNITPSGSYNYSLMGRSNYIFNSYNKTLYGVLVDSYNGTYTNNSIFNLSMSSGLAIKNGTFDFNDYDASVALVNVNYAGTNPILYLGNGTITARGHSLGYAFLFQYGTIYPENSILKIESTLANNLRFEGYNKTFNKLVITTNTSYFVDISGNNTFNEIIIDAGRKVRITNGTTQTINRLRVLGKPSNLSTLASTTAGSRATITMSSNDYLIDYTNIKDINFTNATKVGQNSVDLGNNVNADFLSTVMRYWVGNGGNWNDTTHWSLQSNGASGAVVPTATENAMFDLNSFSLAGQTVTVNAAANMLALWTEGVSQAFTLTNAVYNLSVYGSLYISSNLNTNFTSTGYLYFRATDSRSIYANGTTKAWNQIYFNGVGGTWTNQDDWNTGIDNTTIYLVNGTLNTNSKTITFNAFNLNSGVKTLVLGNSIINSQAITLFGGGFTFDCGTSTVYFQSSINAYGNTFYDIVFNQRWTSGNASMTEINCRNLTLSNSISSRLQYVINGYLNVTNILSVNGIIDNRLLFTSGTIGSQRTITAANVIASNVDFRDIKFTNPIDLSTITGGSGDCGGNSGITFTPSQTQYFKHTSGAVNWGDSTKWFSDYARTVQGRMPLAQDYAILDENSFTGSATLTMNVSRVCGFDMSAVNQAVTMYKNITVNYHGDFILGNNVTPNFVYPAYINLFGKAGVESKLNTYAKSLGASYLQHYQNTYRNYSDINMGNANTSQFRMGLPSAVFYLNNYNLSCYSFNIISITIYFGGSFYAGNGTITCKIGGEFGIYRTRFYAEQSTVILTSSSSSDVTVDVGSIFGDLVTINKLILSGTITANYILQQSYGSTKINELTIDAGKKVKFEGGRTFSIGKMNATGTLANPITITSTTTTPFTLVKTQPLNEKIECDYLNLSYSTVTPTKTWYAGSNSIDGGNNTNWIFGNFTSRDIIVQSNNKILVDNNGRIVW